MSQSPGVPFDRHDLVPTVARHGVRWRQARPDLRLVTGEERPAQAIRARGSTSLARAQTSAARRLLPAGLFAGAS